MTHQVFTLSCHHNFLNGLRKLRSLAVIPLIALQSGCVVYQLDDSQLDTSAQPYRVEAPFRIDDPAMSRWLRPEHPTDPEVSLERTPVYDSDMSGISLLGYFLTLTLVPVVTTFDEGETATIVWEQQPLVASEVNYQITEYFGLYFPTPMLFLGTLDDKEAEKAKAEPIVNAMQAKRFADQIQKQRQAFQRIDTSQPDALAGFLRQPGEAPLFLPRATRQLAMLAPESDSLSYHRQYAELPGYISQLPVRDQAWLIGPEGLRGWQISESLQNGTEPGDIVRRIILAYPKDEVRSARWQVLMENINQGLDYTRARARADNDEAGLRYLDFYPGMTDAHRAVLTEAGLPEAIVSQMSNRERSPELVAAAKTGSVTGAEGKPLTEEELLSRLVRNDNQGKYMSPYTSDGVLAEWVNSAINADIGATVGSGVGAAAGAYAANKALESTPFGGLLSSAIGGAVGSSVGEEVGRETAIAASGGWSAIRQTSDRSFDSLADMARYLKQKYGNTRNFSDAMGATAQIYPDLQEYL